MLKVSVIVPTYCSGAGGLDRVIASLDRQSMPQQEFERIFVDDGSPDDTFARLQDLAATRSNMRVTRIDNSGWPSRPRNTGADLAQGEYVVFMDHDDALYPEALQRAYDFARESAADLVNPKEVRTSDWLAYWGRFARDAPAGDRDTPMLVMPMTPHKMYRLAFLREHDIRFREGARVLWEDFFFNLEVYARTRKVAVLSSSPFYRWVITPGENNSSTYGRDLDEYFRSLDAMLAYSRSGILSAEDSDWMVVYQYGVRALSRLTGRSWLARSEEERSQLVQAVQRLVAEHVPEALDDRLGRRNRMRAHLLRSGRSALLTPLAEAEHGVALRPTVTALRWDGRCLVIAFEVRATQGADAPFVARRVDSGLACVLPEALAAALPEALLDVTDEVTQSASVVSVKSREDDIGWVVPTTSEATVVDLEEGLVTVAVRGGARLDPADDGFGRPLGAGRWSVGARTTSQGFTTHTHLQYEGPAVAALVDGRLVVAHAAARGRLSVDVGGSAPTLLAFVEFAEPGAVRVVRSGWRHSRVILPVTGFAIAGVTRLVCELRLRPTDSGQVRRFRAELVAEGGGARIEADIDPPPGSYKLRLAVSGSGERPRSTGLLLTVARTLRVTISAAAPTR